MRRRFVNEVALFHIGKMQWYLFECKCQLMCTTQWKPARCADYLSQSSDTNDGTLLLPQNRSEGATEEARCRLVFKKKVKAKGRSKRASKQFSFNRTSADRTTKRKLPSVDGASVPKRRKCVPTDDSEDDDGDNGGKPTCLVCYARITGGNRSTLPFTKYCSMKVHRVLPSL